MKQFLFIIFSVFISTHAFAQLNAEDTDYNTLIDDAIDDMGRDNYEAAIKKFTSVPEGDSAYYAAQLNASVCLIHEEKYNDAIKICKNLTLEDITFGNKAYIFWAIALDSLGKDKEAIDKFNEGIAIYPNNYFIHYKMALAYKGMDSITQAVHKFQDALYLYPNHVQSNIQLGLIAYQEEEYVRAMLSFMYAITICNDSYLQVDLIKATEGIANVSPTDKPRGNVNFGPDCYEDVNFLFKNRVALNKKYKDQSEINFACTKQFQMILEKVEYSKDIQDFWMQFYLPVLKKIYETDNYAGYIYYAFSPYNNKNVQRKVKKGNSKLSKFLKWAAADDGWLATIRHKYRYVNGNVTEVYLNLSDGITLGTGQIGQDGLANGYWQFYHNNGRIMSTGYFSKDKRDSSWVWYHEETGKLKQTMTYKNGEPEGISSEYNKDGIKISDVNYIKGKQEGPYYYWNEMGDTLMLFTYVNDEQTGSAKLFFKTGGIDIETELLNNKIEGKYISYFANGQRNYVGHYKNDEADGDFETYYVNGQLNTIGTKKEGELHGDYKKYYINGQLEAVGKYKDGKEIGPWKNYFYTGELQEEVEYDENGKINAVRKVYDKDGKLFLEETYKNGDLLKYTAYDKNGNVIHSEKKSGKQIYVKRFLADGTIEYEGELIDNEMNGEWKYYDEYGAASSVVEYQNDKQTGDEKYYYPSGKLKSTAQYTDDEPEGLNTRYYLSGTIKKEGYFKNGDRQGLWYSYFPDGKISRTVYYDEGDYKVSKEFDCIGKLYLKTYYDGEAVTKMVHYDTTGNVTQTIDNFNGVVERKFPLNNKTYCKSEYKNGILHGKTTWYYGNGKVEVEGNYVNGEQDGIWTWYYPNGSVFQTKMFTMGLLHGEHKRYFEQTGKLWSVTTYEYDKRHGPNKYYHPNGKLELDRNYVNDKLEGKVVYTDENGEIYQIRFYNQDKLIGYSYIGKDGKELAMIPFNGNGSVTFYYKTGEKSLQWDRTNGLLNGNYTRFAKDGTIIENNTYVDDYVDGYSFVTYKPGQKWQEINYSYDQHQGPMTLYYPNGKKFSESIYINNSKHGDENVYNSNGKLILIRHWYNDHLVSETPVK